MQTAARIHIVSTGGHHICDLSKILVETLLDLDGAVKSQKKRV